MRQVVETIEVEPDQQQMGGLRLLLVPDSWSRNFLQNLRELFSSGEHIAVDGDAAVFWPDVFVHRGLPWWRFLQSGAYHVGAIFMIWAGSRFLALQPQPTVQPAFTHADVIYYTSSEYLPPIDTRRADPPPAERPDPEYSAQPIISLPPEAENHTQTVVAPPRVRLHRDVALPNVVAWSEKPPLPIAPAPVVLASETSRLAPKVDQAVVAPPPEVADRMQPSSRETPNAPRLAVIAPPPEVDAESSRPFGDLDIGRSTVIAPAPQLSLQEQRASRTGALLSAQSVRVVAPPPSVGTGGESRTRGNMIALNLHPSITAPAEAVKGTRRGRFATAPEGHHGSTGAAGNDSKRRDADATRSAKQSNGDLPAGLYVGKGGNSPVINPNLIADARPPRISARTMQPESASRLSEEERAVFGDRKFYSLTLNMPNLNSAGGSWVIRFAALNGSGTDESYGRATESAYAAPTSNDNLSAPSATRKVDPAYPLELMRQNVGGTVILYAVIRSDGTVSNIRVLRSVDQRLDRYASQAIAKWQFDPARKNGSPVDVEATFWIPFRPAKTSSGF
jgi:TonB family protein